MVNLKAGAGSARIEFVQEMLPTEGFGGIHDLPYARALCLEGGNRVVLISLDLVMLDDKFLAGIREMVGEKLEVACDNIWVHVTHAITTPHAPGPMGPPDKRPDPTPRQIEQFEMFRNAVMAAISRAVETAKNNIKPVKMGSGKGTCMLNANRDVETPFGWWINIGDGPSDHTMSVVKFEGDDGKPVAFILNYDMKPCTIDNSEMEKGTRLISADIPGNASRILEEKYGVPALYFMGAAGDQVPRDMALLEEVDGEGKPVKVDKGVAYGLQLVEEFTKEMVADATEIIDGINGCVGGAEITLKAGTYTWQTKGRGKMVPSKKIDWQSEGEMTLPVSVITIGDVALVGVKPEICNRTSSELKEASPYETTLLVSMFNGGYKYMPDRKAYDRCTWEAQSAGMMPGAAEEFVKTALQLLDKTIDNHLRNTVK